MLSTVRSYPPVVESVLQQPTKCMCNNLHFHPATFWKKYLQKTQLKYIWRKRKVWFLFKVSMVPKIEVFIIQFLIADEILQVFYLRRQP